MARITSSLRNLKKLGRFASETGAAMVEYTLLVALIAAVAIGALVFLGGGAKDSLCNTGNAITNAGVPTASQTTSDCTTP